MNPYTDNKFIRFMFWEYSKRIFVEPMDVISRKYYLYIWEGSYRYTWLMIIQFRQILKLPYYKCNLLEVSLYFSSLILL